MTMDLKMCIMKGYIKMFKNHFNYSNLISMKLANDTIGKNIY